LPWFATVKLWRHASSHAGTEIFHVAPAPLRAMKPRGVSKLNESELVVRSSACVISNARRASLPRATLRGIRLSDAQREGGWDRQTETERDRERQRERGREGGREGGRERETDKERDRERQRVPGAQRHHP
jgi:general stress protein YciG